MSQYSFSPPLLLPIACVYSQSISGIAGRLLRALHDRRRASGT